MQYVGDNLPRVVRDATGFALTIPGCTVIELTGVTSSHNVSLYTWCQDQEADEGYFGYEMIPTGYPPRSVTYTVRYYFTNAAVAMAFKLRWA